MVDYLNGALSYATQPRLSIPKKTKIVEWNPIGTFNNNLGSGDIVRFNISTQDFWDPYSAYLEVTVSLRNNSDLDTANGIGNRILQVDGSAKNIFNQLIVYEQSQELERIQSLDVLQTILQDVCYDTETRYNKDYEGLGGIIAKSFPNSIQTSFRPYIAGGATVRAIKHFMPDQNSNYAMDGQFNACLLGTTFAYTTNHSEMFCQTGFQPYLNPIDTTFSGNSKVTESANDFADFTNGGGNMPLADGAAMPYNPAFCNMGGEPFFSKTVQQRYMKNGFVTADYVTEATFFIPLMSGIFGGLVHPANYKLIPMKYFKELVFEFQFNPHFLFSSWFSKNNAVRNYQVKNLVMHATLTEIKDQGVLDRIDAEYQQGIQIPYQSWYLGPLYPITNGVVPPTVQINLGFESLRNVLFCFLPNDHTANSAARKQYRLSMGINRAQLKISTDYYPQLAIEGNGGNNLGPQTNYQFLRYLYKAFNKHMNPQSCSINPHNFSVNCRAFDPNSTDASVTGVKQLGFFEENRVIGKAVYAIPLDSINYTNELLGGVDTTIARPFEIHLGYDSSRVFTRPVTMYTFCQFDGILNISPNGISTMGKS